MWQFKDSQIPHKHPTMTPFIQQQVALLLYLQSWPQYTDRGSDDDRNDCKFDGGVNAMVVR